LVLPLDAGAVGLVGLARQPEKVKSHLVYAIDVF